MEVTLTSSEKVVLEHRLEGRKEWPSGGKMFQAEVTASNELGWECVWHVPGTSRRR